MTANPNLAAHQKSLGKQGAFIDVNAVLVHLVSACYVRSLAMEPSFAQILWAHFKYKISTVLII